MIARTLRAIAHLRPAQAVAVGYRRVVPFSRARRAEGSIVVNTGYRADPFCSTEHTYDESGFTFVGLRAERSGSVDWRAAAMPRLWRYHLQAFDWLRDRSLAPSAALAYVEDWIRANPVGTRDAWEPYPVSRRIGNWIDLFARPAVVDAVSDGARASLAAHALWLERNLETHLLANHYLENARALMLAGAYFSGEDADRWRATGERVLRAELPEQILADGGHVERSPMYHALVLEGLLDIANVARANPEIFSNDIVEEVFDATRRALEFLAAIVLPDGTIPLFNDSALDEAQPPARLFAYGVADAVWPGPPAHAFVSDLAASGYYVVSRGGDALVVDCGELGPAYQSGHGHADLLAYEYVLGGQRIVSDAGVFGYDDDARRKYARSAAAHSTVTVDDAEPCELWGAFRTGRRAHPLAASMRATGPDQASFVGSHDGFRHLAGQPTISRAIDWDDGSLLVRDHITSTAAHTVTSRITLGPHIEVERGDDMLRLLKRDGAVVAEFRWHAASEMTLLRTERYPTFGVSEPSVDIVLKRYGVTKGEVSYRITKQRPQVTSIGDVG